MANWKMLQEGDNEMIVDLDKVSHYIHDTKAEEIALFFYGFAVKVSLKTNPKGYRMLLVKLNDIKSMAIKKT